MADLPLPLSDVLICGLKLTDLDIQCPREIINKIAGEILGQWEQVGRELGVSERRRNNIRYDNTRFEPEQKAFALLDAWTEEKGSRATCLKLAEALHRREMTKAIEIICKGVAARMKTNGNKKPEEQSPPPPKAEGIRTGTIRAHPQPEDPLPPLKQSKHDETPKAVDTGAPSSTSLSITPPVAATQSGSQGHSSGGGILFPSDRWELESLHSIGLDGRSTKIAILDSDIYADHLSLSSKIADGTCTRINFVPTENDWKGSTPLYSFNHGTAVAAVVGGQSYASDDGQSVPVGVAPKCELIICRITADDKMYYLEAALQYLCTVENLDIVCMSFSIDKNYSTTATRQLLKQLRERGVVCIGAAGNKGEYQPRADFPASDSNVLSVGALTCHGHIAELNTSSVVHAYAHGEMIVPTTTSISAVKSDCGTSFAVPMVAGFLSLLIQCTKDPTLYQSPHARCNIEMVSEKYHDIEFLIDLFECNKLCKDKKLIYVKKFLKEIIDRRGENYLLKLIQEEHDPTFSC